MRAAALMSRQRILNQYGVWQQWATNYRQEFNNRITALSTAAANQYPPLPPPMAESELFDLVTFYTDREPVECGICLEDITYEDAIIKLVCHEIGPAHQFHFGCSKTWFTTEHAACPNCRKEIDRVEGIPHSN